ncbi:MAG: hypothetical protein WA982_17450 [Rubrobacteraceae bacterium]
MNWQSQDDVPKDNLLPKFSESVRTRITDSPGTDETSRSIAGELIALSEQELKAALDLLLRTLTSAAALTDAVLETSAVRLTSPRSTQSSLVCEMARELWDAGFRVTFGHSWEPVTDADLALGAAGDNDALKEFVLNSESWETTPRNP